MKVKMKMRHGKDYEKKAIKADKLKAAKEIRVIGDGGGHESYTTVYRYNDKTGRVDVADYTELISNVDLHNETYESEKLAEHDQRTMSVTQALEEINYEISMHDEEGSCGTYVSVLVVPNAMQGHKTKPSKKNYTLLQLKDAYKRMI